MDSLKFATLTLILYVGQKCSANLNRINYNLSRHYFLFKTIFLLAKKDGSFDHVIVNDELEKAYSELKSIVMKVSDSQIIVLHL